MIVGFLYFNNKKIDIEEIRNNSEVKSLNTTTFTLGNGPIEFDLPEGYGVFTSSAHEGGYEFTARIGKMLRDNSFSEAVANIYIRDFVPQDGTVGEYINNYKPSEYINFSLNSYVGSEPVTLFGNKAVKIFDEASGDGSATIIGYLRADQLPEIFGEKEYLVTINGSTYGSGKEFSQELFDMVVKSLRIKFN